ncbi:MAG: hypothetical protein ACR2MX_11175 [Cyclobacteriaceae bacterium]
MNTEAIIQELLAFSNQIRYVAIYHNNELKLRQKEEILENSSSKQTDRFEELLVNPTLLTLTSQRGNIDCGGLDHLIIGYGNFHQLVKPLSKGHLSVCLEKDADLNIIPGKIVSFLATKFPEMIF